MNTRLKIELDKNGNIKSLKTPYDNDKTINSSFKKLRKKKQLDAMYSNELNKQFATIFKGFGESFTNNFNNQNMTEVQVMKLLLDYNNHINYDIPEHNRSINKESIRDYLKDSDYHKEI